jgi:predicted nucleic acid-binding protein
MSYLLDTNVLSETVKNKPDKKVISWLKKISNTELYISVLTIGEIQKGISLLPQSRRKTQIINWLDNELAHWFAGRIIPVNTGVSENWGIITAKNQNLPSIDGLIAATALSYDLCLVTRNAKDFTGIDNLKIINPWEIKSSIDQ